MPATLYLRPSPRALVLLTDTHALVFRQPDASETGAKATRSVVVSEFLPIEEIEARQWVLIRVGRGRVEGVLGVTSVPSDRSPIPEIFLLLVTAASPLSPLLPGSPLRPARVVAVEFHSLSSAFWDSADLVAAASSSSSSNPSSRSHSHTPLDALDEEEYGTSSWASSSGYHTPTQSQASAQGVEHPCAGMRKYLESGGFFFAEGAKWDISSRMGEANWVRTARAMDGSESPSALETFDERFTWNAHLLEPLLSFRRGLGKRERGEMDAQALLLPVIQGFVGSSPISPAGAVAWDGGTGAGAMPLPGSLGLISRLSWKRAGARFRTRGIDDDGHVANFVESEVVLVLPRPEGAPGAVYTWTTVRGSVPLFWQQPQQGLGTLQQRVEITRPPQASQPAFDKHFMGLLAHYHSVHAVNLLGHKDAEAMLSAAYAEHLANLRMTLDEDADVAESGESVLLTEYDFHSVVRNQGHEAVRFDMGTRLREVVQSRQRFGWTAIDAGDGRVERLQRGVFRVNCLDCLDRTNYVQDVLSSLALGEYLREEQSTLVDSSAFWSAHRELWADNGDRLSKTYAGTGALNTSATRSGKKTFAGLLSDATKSVGRAYINNFQDKGKQEAIDMLLGMMAGQRPVVLFDPVSDNVQAALQGRAEEYSRKREVGVWVGTWNLNGTPPGEGLGKWLFPSGKADADIYMVAFQEIVQLTPGQILQTDPAKRRMWEQYLSDTFAAQGGEHILYRSEQLVGTALIVFVRSSLTPAIRHVESATKKTGLQGLSGNKGGVGLRFTLFDSSVCLMTCHLAAGHSNVAERNADYRTVLSGLKFLRGKTIEDHEIVIWAADFNYRVSLPNDEVRALAQRGEIDALLSQDQLLQARDEGEVFRGYEEGAIAFLPTYKYDNGTDTYDSSEKARIPAWTDRILYRGPLELREYDRAELRTSDHRPVFALFGASVREVDEAKKEIVRREVMGGVKGEVKARARGPMPAKALAAVGADRAASSSSVDSRSLKLKPDAPMHSRPVPFDSTPRAGEYLRVRELSLALPTPAPPRRTGTKVDGSIGSAPPPLPSRPSTSSTMNGATASAPSLMDDVEDEAPTVKPLLPSRPGVGSSKPPLPTRKPSGVVVEMTPADPSATARPALPQRPRGESAASGTGLVSPIKEKPAVPARPAKTSERTSNGAGHPPSSSPAPAPASARAEELPKRPKSGSVLDAIAALEVSSRTPPSSTTSTSAIKRKPPPKVDIFEAHSRGSTGSTIDALDPSVTGDFVLVNKPKPKANDAGGTGAAAGMATGMAPAPAPVVGPKPDAPRKAPPVAPKPDMLRGNSSAS